MFTSYIPETTLVGRNIYYLPLLGSPKFKCKFYLSTSAPKSTPDTLLFQDYQNIDKKSLKIAFSNHTDILCLYFEVSLDPFPKSEKMLFFTGLYVNEHFKFIFIPTGTIKINFQKIFSW